MNQDIFQGRWKQITGRMRLKWAKLQDDDLLGVQGNRDYLLGKLQERYGWSRELAEVQVREIERGL